MEELCVIMAAVQCLWIYNDGDYLLTPSDASKQKHSNITSNMFYCDSLICLKVEKHIPNKWFEVNSKVELFFKTFNGRVHLKTNIF